MLDDLARAQALEQATEARKRIAKSLTGNDGTSAPVAAASAPAASPVPVVRAVPVVPPKRVAAIYGPIGREVAEIETADGVLVVHAGERVGGYRVVRVANDVVEMAPATRAVANRGRGEVVRRGAAPAPGVRRFSVGDSFK